VPGPDPGLSPEHRHGDCRHGHVTARVTRRVTPVKETHTVPPGRRERESEREREREREID
jgi:hypothetical protein